MRYISFDTHDYSLHINAEDIAATYENHNSKTIEIYVKGMNDPFIVNSTADNHNCITWLWEEDTNESS